MKEKIWRQIFWFAKPKILTPCCRADRGVKFCELCDWISGRNRNWIRKYLSLFIRGPDKFESWKNGGRKSRDTLPLKTWIVPSPNYANYFTVCLTHAHFFRLQRHSKSRRARWCDFEIKCRNLKCRILKVSKEKMLNGVKMMLKTTSTVLSIEQPKL